MYSFGIADNTGYGAARIGGCEGDTRAGIGSLCIARVSGRRPANTISKPERFYLAVFCPLTTSRRFIVAPLRLRPRSSL